jgi:ATP-binding cassette subfamily F protein 3
MEALSTKTLELESGAGKPRARLFYGNYAYYLEKTASTEKPGIRENAGYIAEKTVADSEKSTPPKSAEERRVQNKQRQTETCRLEKQETSLLGEIEKLETEKAGLETELSLPGVYSVGEKAKAVKQNLDRCGKAIAEKTAEWEAVVEKLETAKTQ